nr:hypothetical protein CFP56_21722 [Quercus suber]
MSIGGSSRPASKQLRPLLSAAISGGGLREDQQGVVKHANWDEDRQGGHRGTKGNTALLDRPVAKTEEPARSPSRGDIRRSLSRPDAHLPTRGTSGHTPRWKDHRDAARTNATVDLVDHRFPSVGGSTSGGLRESHARWTCSGWIDVGRTCSWKTGQGVAGGSCYIIPCAAPGWVRSWLYILCGSEHHGWWRTLMLLARPAWPPSGARNGLPPQGDATCPVSRPLGGGEYIAMIPVRL